MDSMAAISYMVKIGYAEKKRLTHQTNNICDYIISEVITITAGYLLAGLDNKEFSS